MNLLSRIHRQDPGRHNPGRHNLARQNHGFTLIEILITVVVLSIGLLGLAGLQITGLRANMSSESRSKATLLANNIAERMRTNTLGVHNETAAEDNQYANITTAGQNCGNRPAPFCSNFNDGAATIAEVCTPAEMAVFDAWVWACGMPKGADVVSGGITNILMGGAGSVVCNDIDGADADGCSPGSPHAISISWNELNPNETDADAAGDTLTQSYTLVVVP